MDEKGRRLLPSRPRILLSCEVRCVLARIPQSIVVLAAAAAAAVVVVGVLLIYFQVIFVVVASPF